MALPDISRFASLPDETWRVFGQRLREIGLTTTAVAPIVGAVQSLAPPLRRPARTWLLRKVREPAGYAMRLLLFQDPVTVEEAEAALGELLSPLLRAGLLELIEDPAGAESLPALISSPFVLAVVNDLYILSDDLRRGGEAVMGLGEATIALCRAAAPERPLRRVLDLGCGAGTCALVLSPFAGQVVGTDVNPRALAMARVNAAINGIVNMELLEGSLFDPVKDEAFDLIVSQPPFVPMPEGAGGATFLYGGRRGDEIALELLSGVAGRLAAGGRAVLVIEWPSHGDEPLEERVRRAAGPALNVLLLTAPSTSPVEHATAYAAGLHPLLDEAFERDVTLRCEHLERLQISDLSMSFVVLEHALAEPAWTRTVSMGPVARAAVTSGRIGKILAARALAGDRDRLLAATLRVPAGTVLAEEQDQPGADVPSTIWARFSEEALVQPTRMTPDMLGLVTVLHESPSVREGVEQFAAAYGVPIDAALERLLPVVERALCDGLLEVVPPIH